MKSAVLRRSQNIQIKRTSVNEDKRSMRSVSVNRALPNRTIPRQISRQVAPRRNIRLEKRSEIWFAGGLFLILLTKLFVRVSIVETSYKIENVRKELLAEDTKLRELRVNKAMVANPRQLVKLAQEKIAMQPILPQQIRKIKLDE
jgi:hypothetical protein